MNLMERSPEGIREIKVSLTSIKSLEGTVLKTRQRDIQITEESQYEVLRQMWLHRGAMSNLRLYNTRHSHSTGCQYAKIAPNYWQHIDTNDEINRPVGDFYLTRENLLADHLPYLLRAGWLNYYEVEQLTPIRQQSVCGQNETWELYVSELGIRVIGNTPITCTANFLLELRQEFGTAVTVAQTLASNSA